MVNIIPAHHKLLLQWVNRSLTTHSPHQTLKSRQRLHASFKFRYIVQFNSSIVISDVLIFNWYLILSKNTTFTMKLIQFRVEIILSVTKLLKIYMILVSCWNQIYTICKLCREIRYNIRRIRYILFSYYYYSQLIVDESSSGACYIMNSLWIKIETMNKNSNHGQYNGNILLFISSNRKIFFVNFFHSISVV